MADVDQHNHHCLYILESAAHDADFFIFFEQTVVPVQLETEATFSFLLYFLHEFLFPFFDEGHKLISENEFALDFTFGIIQLRGFLFYGVCD